MAWIEKRGRRYQLNLEFNGQHMSRSLKTCNKGDAEACLFRVEENLRLLERGRLELPAGADLFTFLLSDGKIAAPPKATKAATLGELFGHYRDNHPEGAKEATTRYTEDIHIKHLLRLLGAQRRLAEVTGEVLQSYVDARCRESSKFRRTISPTTIRKEISTLGSIWNRWGMAQGMVAVSAPTKGLVYRKAPCKPPFQTREQIERQVARGGLSEAQIEALWESLFLSREEIDEILRLVRGAEAPGYLYPMFVFAAHSGTRRSEMVRSRIDDFDFSGGSVTIREKKRDRSREVTYRTVPLSPLLRETMRRWFEQHPGGGFTLCQMPDLQVTVQRASQHFRKLLDGSGWDVLPGWHVFRHSFCSNCARQGIDQRIIDAWMGHQTEDMRRRYRHLFPDQQRQALLAVFG